MDFQAVEQENGNLVQMFGIITEFTGEGINPKSSKPWKKVKIRDNAGVTHTVTLRGELPSVAIINQRTQFNLSTYQGTSQGQPYTGYSGFWNKNAQTSQHPTAPQQPQQASSRAPEEPKPDWDAIAPDKVRHGLVCAAIQSGQIKVAGITDFEYWKNYIVTGRAPLPPSKVPEPDPSITGDNIPY